MAFVHKRLTFLYLFCFRLVLSQTSLAKNQSLTDPKTLVSSNSIFVLGFFSPANSASRYVGIWYSDSDSDGRLEVVWVANRNNPLSDSSGVLTISKDGNLQVLNGQNVSFWSSNVSSYDASNSVAQLRDDGNLVLQSNDRGTVLWRSFDYPTDVILPGMSFTIDSTLTKQHVLLRSWKGPADPSGGNFTTGVKTSIPPELFLWDRNRPYWRNGPWNGNLFLGLNYVLSSVTDNTGKVYFGFSLTNQSAASPGWLHLMVNYDGILAQRNWDSGSKKWKTLGSKPQAGCDFYGKCGRNSSCKATSSPICSCLRGFLPNNNTEWSKGNWTGGCVRRRSLQCGAVGARADRFWKMSYVKVPDHAVWLPADSEDECSSLCIRRCSCLAYSYFLSIGCMIWNDSLIDILEFPNEMGIDLSVRLAYSELGMYNEPRRTSRTWKVIVIVSITITTAILGIIWLHRQYGARLIRQVKIKLKGDRSAIEFDDLPMFELHKLEAATNNFQESNELGRGGFGIVYKGELEGGEEVAVKRLSKLSGQGLTEFMTEVLVISKLQHRNLVRLLGCCVEGEEKLLIYEYMSNKGLDALLFDQLHREALGWKVRFNIILGICRGLLYLHRDSRLKVIHRDLKASNILLDDELTPKISDFGMARIFGGNVDYADTNRVVGTYGYMSPEYAMEGRFSEKSDVFSFGVLMLEIISGRRNNSFRDEESLSLLAHAWILWNEGNISSSIDPAILESDFQDEVFRCIQVALLCVQEFPEDRPNMSMVLSMIDNEVSTLPRPTQPGITQRRYIPYYQDLQDVNVNPSLNLVSLSDISGR